MIAQKGYEKLCCLACAQHGEHNFGTTCICRVHFIYTSYVQVPKANLPEGKLVECCHCGCRGCASGDGGKRVFELYVINDQSKKRDHEDETDDVRKRIADLSNLMKETEEEES